MPFSVALWPFTDVPVSLANPAGRRPLRRSPISTKVITIAYKHLSFFQNRKIGHRDYIIQTTQCSCQTVKIALKRVHFRRRS